MRTWPFLLILGLTGCAQYHPQPLAPEKTAATLEGGRLADPDLRKFLEENLGRPLADWPQTNWDFRSLTLAAFHFHPSLAVARAQWLVASAGVRTAAARPNPTVGVQPGYDTQIPGSYSPWIVPVSFDVPIETAGKRAKRLALAEKTAEAARWDFVTAAWQIRANVRSSLIDYDISQRRADLLNRQYTELKNILGLLQQRLQVGQISRPDLIAEQITLTKTAQDLSDAQANAAAARAHLAGAMGLPLAALDGINLKSDPTLASDPALTSADARRIALLTRADIRSALADYAATEADLRLQIAKQYPDLHVGPGYQWNNGSAGDSEWILGLNLELPILDHNQGPIAEAEARRQLSAAKFVELQAAVIGQIDRAAAGLEVARRQMRLVDQLQADEQKQLKSVQGQLEAGAGDRLDLLTAQLEVSAAAITRLDNEAKLQAAIAEMEDALQRPADSISAAIAKITP
jgi:outer membrane protein TolC